MNKADQTKFRDLLLEKQRELELQVEAYSAATQPVTLDQQSVGRVSRIDAIQQQQMAVANQQQAQQLLVQVELAIQRIKSDTYGLCLSCDENIPVPRLVAQPFASLCVDCQSASETN